MIKIKHLGKMVFLLLCSILNLAVFAQEIALTGTVKSVSGESLPGVSIVVKGTSTGTITDVNGNYSIENLKTESVLVFSFVGFLSQEIQVGNQNSIDVVLEEDLMELEEIVVIGYGVTKKSDVTGALSSLKEDDFNKGAITSPEQLLQGRVSGVKVTPVSGEPGAGMKVQIRGASSISSNTDPLYVVDGVPLDKATTTPNGADVSGFGSGENTSPLNFLNPDDIASIDILKDASAAAIYGSRAANGVVIITTKKAAAGEAQIDYSAYTSISKIPKKIDVLSANEWVNFRNELGDKWERDYSSDNLGAITNWQDEIFRTGHTQSHNLSFSSATEKNSYRASFGYFDQDGIIKASNLERYTGRLSVNQKALNDLVTIDGNITVSRVNQQRPPIGKTTGFEGDLLINAIQTNPTMPVLTDTGTFYQPEQQNKRNPVAMYNLSTDEIQTDRIIANLSGSATILKGLNFKVNLGLDNSNANRWINHSQQLNYMVSDQGLAAINGRKVGNYLIENTLNYSNSFGIHKLTGLLGYSYQKISFQGTDLTVTGFESDEIKYTNNIAGATGDPVLSSYKSYDEMESVFGRIEYNYNERLLLTLNARYDGSSKFGINNKRQLFPSLALAYRLSQEQFIKDIGFIYNLKLRAGYGFTGNQEIKGRHSQPSIGYNNDAKGILDGETVTPGLVLLRTTNPNLKWESTRQINVGLDFGFVKGRLSGTMDYFQRKTTEMLMEVDSKFPAPTSTQFANLKDGYISTSGIELSVMGAVVATDDFEWTSNATFTKIKILVKELPISNILTGSASGPGMTGAYVQVITSDEEIYSYYGKKFLGFDDEGMSMFVRNSADDADSVMILGSPNPNFSWGLNNSFRYKKFDLSFFIEGVHGQMIYNNTANTIGNIPNINIANNILSSAKTLNESPLNRNEFSSRYLEDGSFIRLSNFTLGYTFNTSDIAWLGRFRVYVSGNNLFLITDYSGYDPDVNTDASAFDRQSKGIDNSSYPRARTFLAGINVSF